MRVLGGPWIIFLYSPFGDKHRAYVGANVIAEWDGMESLGLTCFAETTFQYFVLTVTLFLCFS